MNAPSPIRVLFFPVGEPPRFELIDNTLEGLHELLGVSCIDALMLDRNVSLICDDEGLLNGSPPNVWAEGPTYVGAPIHGNVCLAGFDRNLGDNVSITDADAERFKNLKRALVLPF